MKNWNKAKRWISVILIFSMCSMMLSGCSIFGKQNGDAVFLKWVADSVDEAQLIVADVCTASGDMAQKSYQITMGGDVETYVEACRTTLTTVEEKLGTLRKLMQKLERLDEPETERGQSINEAQKEYFSEAISMIEEMQKTLSFYIAQYEEEQKLAAVINDDSQEEYQQYLYDVYEAALQTKESYLALEVPQYLKDVWPLYVDSVNTLVRYLQSQSWAASGDVLRYYSAQQLMARMEIVKAQYENTINDLMASEYIHCADVLNNNLKTFAKEILTACDGGTLPQDGYMSYMPITFAHESMIDEIYPNLYPAMDSVVNLLLYTDKGFSQVTITAEIPGFTQLYEQKVSISEEMTYVMVKPPVLAEMPDLSATKDTQISIKVTDDYSGEVLIQESKPLKLYSIYDYKNYTDEFGIIQNDNILAWMTPESDGVLAVRRNAISWLENTFGTSNGILPGYQPSYGFSSEEGAKITYIEVAAIQSAISGMGVRYNMGPYSLNASQRVLMPDAVLSSQSGICIETAVLMASVLQSANMHAMIVFTPGHAQVAVETWSNSGQYFLIETTCLPFDATVNDISSVITPLSNEEWANYLSQKSQQAQESGGMVYIVDCDLAKDLNIKGLAY